MSKSTAASGSGAGDGQDAIHPPPSSSSSTSPVAAASRSHATHQSISSLPPRAGQALSDPDYWPDREGEDDVFSNPDTAELEARSDATGATSPDRATSPAVHGSPEAGLLPLPSEWTEHENKRDQGPHLQHQPSLTSQLTQTTAMAAPKRGDEGTVGDSSADNVTPTPSMLHGSTSPNAQPARGRHRFDGTIALPAANSLPLDPAKASDVSTLFARPPAPATSPTSPVPSSIRLALSQSPPHSTVASAAGSPISERRGFQWSIPAAASTAPVSRSASRGVHRSSSPERQRTIMAASLRPGSSASSAASPLSGTAPGSLGLGLSSVAHGHQEGLPSASESSIFERDIEHRDARHVLSKSEAVDVAIPPVLDDAVEAIIEGGEEPLEIVTPLSSAAPPPLPLSALALSASTQSLSSFSTPSSSGPQSPISSTEPMLSSAAVDDPPPGSIAAQIAERLAPSRSATDEAALSSSPPKGSAVKAPRHRQTQSSSASSVGSSTRSRSPGKMAPMGVQQVLDSSAMKSSTEPSSPVRASSPKAFRPSSVASGAAIATSTPSKAGGPSAPLMAVTPSSQGGAGTALPSLPLPNPFRSEMPAALRGHSPSASISIGSSEAAPPAPISMSLDGAIIPSSESAVRELSLDGMADAIVEAEGAMSSPSPILPRKTMPAPSTAVPAGAFVRRDTSATITPDNKMEGPSDVDAAAAAPSTRRLSFFSYANILNDTPAVLVDLEQSVQRTMEDTSGVTAAAASAARGSHFSTAAPGSSRPSTGVSSASSVVGGDSRRASAGPTSQQVSPTLSGNRIVGSAAAAAAAVKTSSPLTGGAGHH